MRHSTTSQAKFYLESSGHSYNSYKVAHETYKNGLKKTLAAIPNKLRTQVIDKTDLGTIQFGDRDLVVVVGDDGLLVNVAKYIGDQQVISVNPDEERFDGILASCNVGNFPYVFERTLEEKTEIQPLTMVEAKLDDGQTIRALNDLFVGRKTHVSSRYSIEYAGRKERQSSSGIIVSTGTGSTGWLTSVMGGAQVIANGEATLSREIPFQRDANYLIFAVREPFPSKITGNSIVYGEVTEENPFIIESNMPEGGVIFGDGIERDYLEFTSGRTATIQPSKNKVYLVQGK